MPSTNTTGLMMEAFQAYMEAFQAYTRYKDARAKAGAEAIRRYRKAQKEAEAKRNEEPKPRFIDPWGVRFERKRK